MHPNRRHLVAPAVRRDVITDLMIRPAELDDADDLAALLVESYTGSTSAPSAEELDAALMEIHKFFGGLYGEPILAASMVADSGARIAAASLVGRYQGTPLLAVVLTASPWKGLGAAFAVVQSSMNALVEAGETSLALIITAANRPALELMDRLEFTEVGS